MVTKVEAKCVHYWDFPTSGEPQIEGVCKICGERRMFSNQYYVSNPRKEWTQPNKFVREITRQHSSRDPFSPIYSME